ncbi:hypothetical protein SAY87_016532 [Trapa incisa]|uniref:Aminotransferase class V domain-containing protein n=1 Tax=Trapa incisa TaxID=236973 RepID=A0AAN7LH35_9MYRT|nr:hypothetical protein SAY87_016532 [Trapa incisa]
MGCSADSKGSVNMEELRRKLKCYKDMNRPLLGSFSACSNVTGIYTDTMAIAQYQHKPDVLVDPVGGCSGPYVEIDVRSGEADGYDAIFLSPHKFLGGPGSPGILLMSKALYQLTSSAPSTCGGGTVNYVNGFNEKDTIYYDDIEERENAGTPQIIQITKAALAFWVKDYVGYELINKLEHDYISEAIKRLLRNGNMEILGSKTADRQAIFSFLIYSTTNSISSSSIVNGRDGYGGTAAEAADGLYIWREVGDRRDRPLHGAFAATILNDLFGIQSRGGCACAGPYGHALLGISESQSLAIRSAIEKGYSGMKPGWTRISFPYYMSHEEFEFILAALEFVATYGQRYRVRPSSHTSHTTGKMKSTATADIVNEYASYLKCARHVAELLPKFPQPRQLSEDIDEELLYFRI